MNTAAEQYLLNYASIINYPHSHLQIALFSSPPEPQGRSFCEQAGVRWKKLAGSSLSRLLPALLVRQIKDITHKKKKKKLKKETQNPKQPSAGFFAAALSAAGDAQSPGDS